MKKLFSFIMIVDFLVIGYICFVQLRHNLPYKNSDYVNITFEIKIPESYNKTKAKKDVDLLFKNKPYIYKEKNFNSRVWGKAMIPIRKVYIEKDLRIEDYIFTLTHELVHINYMVCNERYTNFTSFKLLYESNNELFKNVALRHAALDFQGCVEYDYSCVGYIKDYLDNLSQ